MPLPARILRISGFFLISLCGCWILYPQTLSVSPNPVTIRMAQSGPVALAQGLKIAMTGPAVKWTATVSGDAPWISLSAMEGNTPATVNVGLVGWRAEGQAAGNYSGTVTFNAPGAAPVAVTVNWSVVARMPE